MLRVHLCAACMGTLEPHAGVYAVSAWSFLPSTCSSRKQSRSLPSGWQVLQWHKGLDSVFSEKTGDKYVRTVGLCHISRLRKFLFILPQPLCYLASLQNSVNASDFVIREFQYLRYLGIQAVDTTV